MIYTGTRLHIKGSDNIDGDGIVTDWYASIKGQYIKIKLDVLIIGGLGDPIKDIWVQVDLYDISLPHKEHL